VTTRIWKVFTFEAAHLLPLVPKEHQCSRLHGHSYVVKVTIGGTPVGGWLIDFAQMKAVWQAVAGGQAPLCGACTWEPFKFVHCHWLLSPLSRKPTRESC